MERLPLPESIDVKEIDKNKADIIIEPAYPGYGNTLGNSLRRVLLSSLPGAAVTAVKIKGITHEFTAIEGVKEDVVQIILNLKKLRFTLHDTDEAKVKVEVSGKKDVTGKDVSTTSDVEVSTPAQHIASLTDAQASLEMELTVKKGRGYVPVETLDKKDSELGIINIDAVFTPVRNVNYRVENVRVGQMTNYDKLILSVTTDGSITPAEAVTHASQILVDHFSQIAGDNAGSEPLEEAPKTDSGGKKSSTSKTESDDEEAPKKKKGRPKKKETDDK